MRLRFNNHWQRGAALTEFALLMPLLIGVLYASIYLLDVGIFRLEAQEVARYRAWSLSQLAHSDYANADHSAAFERSSERAGESVGSVYRSLTGTESRQAAAAILTPDPLARFQERAPILPEAATIEVPLPEGAAGFLLSALGLSGSTNDIAAGFFERAGFNVQGLVTSRASLTLLPPIRAADRKRGQTLASLGASARFDLTDRIEGQRGQTLREGDGAIASTLLVDSWRLADGHAALPGTSNETHRAFAQVVARLHAEAPDVLPSIFGRWVGRSRTEDPGRYVVSRPYLGSRSCSGARSESFGEKSGQFNPFARSGISQGRLQESGAVTVFESLPLFDEPNRACSDMVRVLNARGPNFMGCDQSQTRRCP